MTEAMKQAKSIPSGRSVGRGEEFNRAALSAGVQKKTKRYIDPSKKQDARPSVRIRRSENTTLSAFLAGIEDSASL